MNIVMEWNTRLCTVKDEPGYFQTWELYSEPLAAGVFSKVYGIVEFKDGVRRVDPEEIVFCDETNQMLRALSEMKGESDGR